MNRVTRFPAPISDEQQLSAARGTQFVRATGECRGSAKRFCWFVTALASFHRQVSKLSNPWTTWTVYVVLLTIVNSIRYTISSTISSTISDIKIINHHPAYRPLICIETISDIDDDLEDLKLVRKFLKLQFSICKLQLEFKTDHWRRVTATSAESPLEHLLLALNC